MLKRRDLLLGEAAAITTAANPVFAAKGKGDEIDPFKARVVRIKKGTPANHIYVYPDEFALYLTLEDDRAIYYPVGVAQRHLWEPGTYVIRAKKEWPTWKPTPEMIERNPKYAQWEEEAMPGGPNNPLGTHALYLSWIYYRIHGTHDTRKIGRRSSNGCIGLYNEHIAELFSLAKVGTQVLLI